MMGQRGQAKRREQTGHFTMYSNAEELQLGSQNTRRDFSKMRGGQG